MKRPTLCWLPRCSRPVMFMVFEKSYGEIIGFCSEHRPILRVTVESDIEVEA